MPLFAAAPPMPPDPSELSAEALRAAAEVIRTTPQEQLAEATGAWFDQAKRVLEADRWANQEGAYFRTLHDLLPEPLFPTQGFLFFFALVFALYWFIPRRWNSARVWLLVIASFHFYAAWNASLAFLVTATATVDYFLARGIETTRGRLRYGLTATSILMNLGVLCWFKYRGFFLNELHTLFSNWGGVSYQRLTPLDILIPFGISFYTFEAISYAVDVYRGKVRAERSLPHFMLFILFFPHLVAGPIVRAGDFFRQAHRVKRWNWIRIQYGIQLCLIGLFKKVAVADRLALFCDGTPDRPGPFLDPANYNASAIWLAVVAYAWQIYCDFSGYSDMALGTAHLLGYRLCRNFNLPYLATNVAEFWHRWHISLSTWLRDYLYIPLGGNRGSAWAQRRNLMLTMLLGGLWHGANWSYVLWGGLHGLMLVIHRQFREFAGIRPRLKTALESVPGTLLRMASTYFFVSLCWVFFRPDLDKSWVILERMFSFALTGSSPILHNRSLWYTVVFLVICHVLVERGIWRRIWERTPPYIAGIAYAVTLTASLLLAPEQGQRFIYFTF